MPNMNLIHLKAKELLRNDCDFHCNLAAIAMKYAADHYYLKEA